MSSLRAAAAHTRAIKVVKVLSPSIRRSIGTHGNNLKSDEEKRPNLAYIPINNAPGWNEALATPSEAVVKADRETTTMNEMQQQTIDYQFTHHHDPEVAPTHANYAREEIGGPLSNAGVGEFEGVVGKDDLGPEEPQVESNGRVVTRRTHKETSTEQANV